MGPHLNAEDLGLGKDMFERYTERARRAIFYARDEALKRGAQEIDTCDLILGLTRDPHPPACPFASLHENAAKLRGLMPNLTSASGPSINNNPGLSTNGKIALANAAQEANRDNRYSICLDHLLRGVIRTNDEMKPILAKTGYTLSSTRKASKQTYLSTPDGLAPQGWNASHYLRRILILTALILFVAAVLYLHFQQQPLSLR